MSTRPLILAAILAGAQCVTANLALSQAAQTASPDTQATPNGLSAREIFYLADEVPPPTKAKPTAAAATPHKPTHSRPTPPPAETAQTPEPRESSNYADSSPTAVHVKTVADRKYPALGMRYAVYRLVGSNKEPVDADTVFHSNDHIQLIVDVNTPAFLYVISRGSSGKWSTLFPAADADQNANLVQPHAGYTFPPGEMITFAEPAGKEELFLFLSRQPVHSTEDLMLQIASKGKSVPAEKQEEALPHSNVVEAFNRMDDTQVNLLRDAFSRDLIVEKVNSDSNAAPAPTVAQAPAKDTSVYVVNPSAGADAHVVADVTFRHE
ncbi:MAG TPA: DUF4384 domain-containing protein [Bryobacteraceae bacterium]|nr:DUF4384 domain-containing protein [Bryobacteraceae bacterium]